MALTQIDHVAENDLLAECIDNWLDAAQACAGACEEFAEECERHDAEHCQVCAEVLRECAETCRQTVRNQY